MGLVREYYEKYITEHDAFKVGIFAGIIGAFIGTTIMLIIAVFYGDGAALFFRSIMDYRTADVVLTLSGLDPYLSISTLKLRLVANLAIGIGMGGLGGGYFIKRQTEKEYDGSSSD